ncbi:hypothetical protein LQZ21_00700 [Treponema sp. TIM-1]|uniref:hypothetical protein n=1 Tax=Treponema sp. TIM-1 TaxID=2898417 RepID=UPI00397F7972
MKTKLPFILIFAVFSFLVASCDVYITNNDEQKYFSSYLSNTAWECIAQDFWPEGQTVNTARGQLELKSDTIIVTGPVKALRDFTHTVLLSGYSEESASGRDDNGYWEEGLIHIQDKGTWKSGIAYKLWTAGDRTTKMLTLLDGTPNETTLRRLTK